MKKQKEYEVEIHFSGSQEVMVKAKNEKEAEKLAMKKFDFNAAITDYCTLLTMNVSKPKEQK